MYLPLEKLLVYNGRRVPNVDMLPGPQVSTYKKPQNLSERLSYRREVAYRGSRRIGRLHCPRIRSEVVKRESS